jgi:uncharacterized protein (TIGR03437 family)
MTRSITICLIAAAFVARAQTPTTLATFRATTAGPTSIIQGSDGNFYGTTGAENVPSLGGIYQMTPAGALTTLVSAANFDPVELLQGSNGNFYCSAPYTGQFQIGLIFEMTPAGAITPLYNFSGPDGANPTTGMIIATDGNFYGTTEYGGTGSCQVEFQAPGCGTTFKITQQGSYTTLHSFTGSDGAFPSDGLIQATDGNFYGTGTTTVPAAPGDVIILWGTGFGPTSPSAPAGAETPSNTTYNTATTVSVTVGGRPATVYGAALAPGYAGLYQVAIQIPASLANGDYPVVATINGASSPSTTMITVQK